MQQILSNFLRKASHAPHQHNSMDVALTELTKKTAFPQGELASDIETTACSASFRDLFHTSLPIDPITGFNIGSGGDYLSDAWGIPNKLGGLALVSAGVETSPADLFSTAEDFIVSDQDAGSIPGFDREINAADDLFSVASYDAGPYADDSPLSSRPYSVEDWLRPDDSTDDSAHESADIPEDPDNYYDNDGLLAS